MLKLIDRPFLNDLEKNYKQKEFLLSEILFNVDENESLDKKV